jgi:L-alanine-DL-glutamate epimerase-like enolase superfamily enzyme
MMIVGRQEWPIRGRFVISRDAKTIAEVVVCEIYREGAYGRGECVPYRRYGETVREVIGAVQSQAAAIGAGLDRITLMSRLPPGAARNAIDCALWDLEAKGSGTPVWRRAGLAEPGPLTTCFTLSLGSAAEMGAAALENAHRPVLKLKLTGDGDLDRVAAVRQAAPKARLVADANEAWTLDQLRAWLPEMSRLGVDLIEQPLPAHQDAALQGLNRVVPLCADESVHVAADLDRLVGIYDAVNVKLDKAGGLTAALQLARGAVARNLKVMLGCMVGTSLGMAPAALLGQYATYVDLDGPLLLARDRVPGIGYDGSLMQPAPAELWG